MVTDCPPDDCSPITCERVSTPWMVPETWLACWPPPSTLPSTLPSVPALEHAPAARSSESAAARSPYLCTFMIEPLVEFAHAIRQWRCRTGRQDQTPTEW